MTDKTCKNCKWWGVDREGACGFEEPPGSPPNTDGFSVVPEGVMLPGLKVFLFTAPDFGCIKFMLKVAR